MVRIFLIVKYTFFVGVVLTASFAIKHFTGIERWRAPEALRAEDIDYNATAPMSFENFDSVLKKPYLKCLTDPSKPFCLLSADKRLELFQSDQAESPTPEIIESRLKNITSSVRSFRHRMHLLLVNFTRLMDAVPVRVVLIEPSMLFCLLSPSKKYNLLTRGFNPGRLQGSRNVVTFGILEKDGKKLSESNSTNEIESAGFKILGIRKSSWVEDDSGDVSEIAHFFFVRQEVAVHLVVFYPRGSYVWHAGLNLDEVDLGDLLYANEGAFEKFTSLPLKLDGTAIEEVFLPSDIRYFLKELEASRFLVCKSGSSSIFPAARHPYLTAEQLRVRSDIALHELKAILAPHMVVFWLWSKTLLGWFDQCDILYHSTTLELSLTLRSIKGLNLAELFGDNEFLKIENGTVSDTIYDLDCLGLQIRIYILREEKNSYWYKHTDGQDIYKLIYPMFDVCSTDVFGQKVNIPCNKDAIMSEHKMNWTDSSFLELEN